MTSINLTLELPEALIERARAAGLLNSERIAALLEMELKRQSAWQRINHAAELVREAAAEDFGHLSEEEVMQMVNDEIHAMRAEKQGAEDEALNEDTNGK
jgi:hypothetical protein